MDDTTYRTENTAINRPSKSGKPLKLVLLAFAILLIASMALAGCGDDTEDHSRDRKSYTSDESEEDVSDAEDADETSEDNDEARVDGDDASEDAEQGFEAFAEEQSIEELASLVQQSQTATVELIRDPDSRQSLTTDADEAIAAFKAQDFETFKQDFIPENFQPIDYPFYYLPEHRITFDTGVSYTIMQDSDNGAAILQFDNNSALWIVPELVYRRTNTIRTTLMEDFSNMHIFSTANDAETAMNQVLNHGLIRSFVLEYYLTLGFDFEGDGGYKVDDLVVGPMPETDPNLYWALIQYSVKPSSEGTLPDNMNIYIEDGWIKGGFMLAAVWNDTRSSGVRSYLLGLTPFEYDVNGTSETEAALTLYEQSYAKNLVP